MKFNILVTGSLYSTQVGYSAVRFCHAAIAAGHTISQIFFYEDGVTQASTLSVPLSDEFDAATEWQELAKDYAIPLISCVSASERRGILSEDQAKENGKTAANLSSVFEIAGLGTLIDASLESDRTVTFK